MKSLVVKRSVMIDGHKTSVSLEDPFWSGLKETPIRRSDTTGVARKDRRDTRARQFVLSNPPVRP